jgi:hypothetical protein
MKMGVAPLRSCSDPSPNSKHTVSSSTFKIITVISISKNISRQWKVKIGHIRSSKNGGTCAVSFSLYYIMFVSLALRCNQKDNCGRASAGNLHATVPYCESALLCRGIDYTRSCCAVECCWLSQIRFWSRHFFSLAARAQASARSFAHRAPRWKFLSSRTARPCFSLRLLINPRLNPIHPASQLSCLESDTATELCHILYQARPAKSKNIAHISV